MLEIELAGREREEAGGNRREQGDKKGERDVEGGGETHRQTARLSVHVYLCVCMHVLSTFINTQAFATDLGEVSHTARR